ncbi:MAG: carbohydrate ABC transporter permease [Microbacteriaceae bacterium]|nr:carbohydrate ABC transporter permease [Microbacteriaceae bacterium]MCL2793798.1 carbohydrate ABC transporter permease [Microbacteriaceae bacterium]
MRARRFPVGRSFAAFLLCAAAALTVFPLIWLVMTSLRKQNTIFNGPIFPTHLTFAAYPKAWESTQFALHFFNSLWITAATVAGVVLFASLAGYAFAKLRFPFKNVLYVLLLATLMMPSTSLIIPLYLQLKNLGLLNTQVGLVILYVSSSAPFAMFLMRAFFETLPDELVQAARVDGAGEFTVFWRVIVPLARPGIATVIIFQFLSTWNEFIYANTVLQDTDRLPLQPVLFSLVGQYTTDWPTLTAGLTMSIVPVVLVYVWMQRQFVAGMTLGAVKS